MLAVNDTIIVKHSYKGQTKYLGGKVMSLNEDGTITVLYYTGVVPIVRLLRPDDIIRPQDYVMKRNLMLLLDDDLENDGYP